MIPVRLTRRGTGIVLGGTVITVAGLSTGSAVVLGAGVFALAVAGCAVTWVLLRRFGCSAARIAPPATVAPDRSATAAAEITVARPDHGPAVLVGLIPPWAASGCGSLETAIRLDGRRVLVQQGFVASRRGVYDWPDLRLELPDPFGIARSRVAAAAVGRTHVLPRIERLPAWFPAMSASGPARGASSAIGATLIAGDDGSPIPRTYRPGDELRRMHWPATARTGQPMVRSEDGEPSRRAVVWLDGSSRGYRTDDGFERAVTAAASIAVRLMDDGWSVGLRSNGRMALDEGWVRGGPGAAAVLVALAAARPAPDAGGGGAADEPADAGFIVLGAAPWQRRTDRTMLRTEEPRRGSAASDRVWDGTAPLASVWAGGES